MQSSDDNTGGKLDREFSQPDSFFRGKLVYVALAFLVIVLILGGLLLYMNQSSIMQNAGSVGSDNLDTTETVEVEEQQATGNIQEGSTRTPRPTGSGTYACSPSGVCNEYDDPDKEEYGCPRTFADRYCLDSCDIEENRCEL